jgi:DNA primase
MNSDRVMLREADLPDLRQMGGRYRAGCPIHGSDHQRSLSIAAEGAYKGFGRCFACQAEVVVREMNPAAAERLEALGARPITPERLLRPIQRRHEAEAQPWQKEEVAALQELDGRMRAALVRSERARAYLEARAIPLAVAEAAGVGYLPPSAATLPEVRPVQKWLDRLVFPLNSPDGRGSIGRALHAWRSGMDENEHKLFLDEPGAPERWRKTYPSGWFGLADLAPDSEQIIIVEGAFDRLALIAAGVSAGDVVALAGSRDSRAAKWIPAHVRGALVALDGDTSGKEAAEALRLRLYLAGLRAAICTPPDDGLGKDWSERWRRGAHAAIWPLLEALDALDAPSATAQPLLGSFSGRWESGTQRR